ncbi:MAG: hypothetical protein WCG78_00285 [Candidatus Omnitrophota bacterium]
MNEEFSISKLDTVTLQLQFKDRYYTDVIFKLSYKNYENLLKFLNITTNRKYLPKDAWGYKGFDVGRNKLIYYKDKVDNKIFKLFYSDENDPSLSKDDKWQIACHKREIKNVKKHHLYGHIFLRQGSIDVGMERIKFVRFRRFVLTADKKTVPSRYSKN